MDDCAEAPVAQSNNKHSTDGRSMRGCVECDLMMDRSIQRFETVAEDLWDSFTIVTLREVGPVIRFGVPQKFSLESKT